MITESLCTGSFTSDSGGYCGECVNDCGPSRYWMKSRPVELMMETGVEGRCGGGGVWSYLAGQCGEEGGEPYATKAVLRGEVSPPRHWHQVWGEEHTHWPPSTPAGCLLRDATIRGRVGDGGSVCEILSAGSLALMCLDFLEQ